MGALVLAAVALLAPPVAGAATNPAPAFSFSAKKLPPEIRREVTGVSWHRGCPVGLSGLRYLRIAFYGFDGRVRKGEMIANASAVPALRSAFGDLYAARFPIRRMRLVDHYGGSDYRSIEADNTSAFNCRYVAGANRWSQHAYGRAIDVNPIENPYVSGGRTSHAGSVPYLNRSRIRPGMLYSTSTPTKALASQGYFWGARWRKPDYQHFQPK